MTYTVSSEDIGDFYGAIAIKHSNDDVTTWAFGREEEYRTACAIMCKAKLTHDTYFGDHLTDFEKERHITASEGFNDAYEMMNCLVERSEYATDPEIEKAIAAIDTRLSDDEHPQKCWRDVKFYLVKKSPRPE